MRELYRCKLRARRMKNREGVVYEVFYVPVPSEYRTAMKLKAGDSVQVTLEV